jgi:hypothetical protein
VPRAGETVTLERLRQFCAPLLALHKHTHRLKLVKSLRRTPTVGQIQRQLLDA